MKKYIIKGFKNSVVNYETYLQKDHLFTDRMEGAILFDSKDDAVFCLLNIAKERKKNGFYGKFTIIEIYAF